MLRRKLWLGIGVFLILLVALGVWIYRSAVLGPDFYRRNLNIDLATARKMGEQLEDRYLNAHNTAVRESSWSLELTDEQLNGWLASTLREKYPRFQPTKIENLRTSFEGNRIRIAFRVRDALIPIVVCVEVVPYVTADEKNIAFRLEHICAGIIPLPKRQATDQITLALSKVEIPVAWTVENGKPLGLLPSDFQMSDGIDRRLQVQNIFVEDDRLLISGVAMDSQ